MRSFSAFLLRSLLTLALLTTATLSAPTLAISDDDLRANLRSCLSIPNALRRLDCFDRLARDADNGATAGSAATPDSGHADSRGAPTNRGSDTNITRPRSDPSPSQADRNIRSRLTRLEQRPRGEWVFHLDNGQIWTELEPGRSQYQEGAEARISRTLFGSHILSVDGMRATRVRRLQ